MVDEDGDIHDPTLALPRPPLPLMTAALSAQADRFLTGDAGTRSLFPDGKFRSLKVLTLGEWLSELHTIPAISPSGAQRAAGHTGVENR